MNMEYLNMLVVGLIFAISLVFHLKQPGSLSAEQAGFRRTAVAFWTWAYGFGLMTYLLLVFLPNTGARDFTLILSQFTNNTNSILFFGVYSSYIRGRTFSVKEFTQVWGPVLLTLTLWEIAWAVQLQHSDSGFLGLEGLKLTARDIRTLMYTPSIFLSMLSAFALGWSFLRRLGAKAILFPVLTAIWGIVQILAYIEFVLEPNQQMKYVVWIALLCLRIPLAIMFFTYIQCDVSTDPIIQPPEFETKVPETLGRIAKILSATVAILLAINGLVDIYRRIAQ